MKSLFFAIILLCSAILAVVIVGFQSGRLLDEFCDIVDESIPVTANPSDVNIVKNKFHDIKPFFILLPFTFLCYELEIVFLTNCTKSSFGTISGE